MSGIHFKSPHLALILGAILTLAFSIRVGVRLAFGEDGFWTNSYSIYWKLADNIVSGDGLCIQIAFGFGNTCDWLPSVYILFFIIPVILCVIFLFFIFL